MKKEHFNKYCTVFGIMALLLSVLAGCGKGAAGNKNGIRIFMTVNSIDTFRHSIVDADKAKAAKEGVELDVADAHGSIEEQVEQIKKAQSEGYDVILCSAVSVDTAVQLKMSAQEMPIVFFNSCPDEKYLEEGKYVYVGSSEQVAGEFQAEYLLSALSGMEEIKVAIIKGPGNHSASKGRTKGLKKVLAASGKKISYVFEDSADWDRDKAQQLFGLFLRTGRSADCIVCNNDTMALGVVQACKNAGIDLESVPVIGVDATADGCEAIEKGEMAFTVYQSGTGQGEAAVDMAVYLAGGKSEKDLEHTIEDGTYVWVDFEKVDSQNASQYGKK